jgi:hypothetical protein
MPVFTGFSVNLRSILGRFCVDLRGFAWILGRFCVDFLLVLARQALRLSSLLRGFAWILGRFCVDFAWIFLSVILSIFGGFAIRRFSEDFWGPLSQDAI